MPDITAIYWHPDRTQPTQSEATLQVDFSDNTQVMIHADTDVSIMSQQLQDLKDLLF